MRILISNSDAVLETGKSKMALSGNATKPIYLGAVVSRQKSFPEKFRLDSIQSASSYIGFFASISAVPNTLAMSLNRRCFGLKTG